MKKNIVREIRRVREIMGVGILYEQEIPANAGDIQQFLLDKGLDIGPYGKDWKFGDDTAKAIGNYIQWADREIETVEDLRLTLQEMGFDVGEEGFGPKMALAVANLINSISLQPGYKNIDWEEIDTWINNPEYKDKIFDAVNEEIKSKLPLKYEFLLKDIGAEGGLFNIIKDYEVKIKLKNAEIVKFEKKKITAELEGSLTISGRDSLLGKWRAFQLWGDITFGFDVKNDYFEFWPTDIDISSDYEDMWGLIDLRLWHNKIIIKNRLLGRHSFPVGLESTLKNLIGKNTQYLPAIEDQLKAEAILFINQQNQR